MSFFDSLNYSQFIVLQLYILFAIEQQHQQNFDFESATYSIEHILPEHPSEEWSFLEEAKQERMKYRIGNMTPLETSRNREIGNKDYPAKRDVYQRSAFKMTQAVAEHYDCWDEQKVEARQKRMADVAAGIWRFEFDHAGRITFAPLHPLIASLQ